VVIFTVGNSVALVNNELPPVGTQINASPLLSTAFLASWEAYLQRVSDSPI
jgi:hypothetical protein